jgi:hypothetical protein
MGWFSDAWDAIKDVGKSVVKTVKNVVEGIIDFVGDVIDFVVSPFTALFDIPDPNIGEQSAQYAQGVTITKSGTTNPLPVVYGYRRLGGNIVFVDTQGDSNKYLYVCYALSHGEVTGLKRLFIDDNELPRSLFTNSDKFPNETVVTVNAGRYSGRAKFQFFRGTETQAQSNLLNESNEWSKKRRRLKGICYLAARYEWKKIETQEDQDNNPFSGGIPRIQCDILGQKVYDIGANHNGSTDITNFSSATKTLSYNPADCLLDYLTNERYGAGLPISEIDGESFYIAHNKLDQQVTYYTGAKGKVMTTNAVIATGNKLLDNTKQLLSGCRGIMPYIQGRYKLKIEDAGNDYDIISSVTNVKFDVDENFIVGDIALVGERKNSYYNQVTVNYVDPDLQFTNQQIVYPEKDSTLESTYLAEDNDEVLSGEFGFPTITNKYVARHIAKMILEKSRSQRLLNFTGTPDLLAIEPGDVIRINHTRLGLTNVLFRVVGMQITQTSNVLMECVEVIATTYPFITTDEEDIPIPPKRPDPILPNPISPQPVVPPIGIVPPEDPTPPSIGFDSANDPIDDPEPQPEPIIPDPPDEPEFPPVIPPEEPEVPPELPEDPEDPQQPPIEPPPPPPPPLPPGVREFKGLGLSDLGFPGQCHKTSVGTSFAAFGTGDANGINGVRLTKYPYSVFHNGSRKYGYKISGLYLNVPADSTVDTMRIWRGKRGDPKSLEYLEGIKVYPNRFSAQLFDLESTGYWSIDWSNSSRLIFSADEYWRFDFVRNLNGSSTVLPDKSPDGASFAEVAEVEYQRSASNTSREFINTNGKQVVRYLDINNNVRYGTSFEAFWNHVIQTQFPGSTGFAGFSASVDLGG